MAIIDPSKAPRFPIPHEPGEWIEVRPLGAGDVELFQTNSDNTIKISIDLLARVIVAWSYPQPVTLENIRLLDLETYMWLFTEMGDKLKAISGVRPETEKKGLENPSSSLPEAPGMPHEAPSLESSLT